MRRRGFTLIEILVVVTILLILVGLTVTAFRASDGQRVRDGSRTLQSAIMGARDRALQSKQPRGLRVIRDPNDQNVGLGIAYLQPLDYLTYGPNAVSLERVDIAAPAGTADSSDVTIVRGVPGTDWASLASLFPVNPRIRIIGASGSGQWYRFSYDTTGPYALTSANPVLRLTSPYIDPGVASPAVVAWGPVLSVEIDMGTELLPMHQPISLPSGVVIDLNRSSAAARQDIMFSPRGMVTGPVAAGGPIYLLLRDVQDVTNGVDPTTIVPGVEPRDMLVVCVFPQTGHCAVYPVDRTDSNGDNTVDDLCRLAKLGSTAGG